ncbi:MAG TPA: MaoC family dehydratase [Spirochaetia bacterium]|nr:MaoC family dehydratase [Spirochaetia bacterium]
MGKRSILQISIGDKAEFAKTISEGDIYNFAGLTGDFNELHINRVAAEKSVFGGIVAHGILSAGLISTVIGTRMPGPGTIYLSQDIKFLKPVRPNDTVRAEVEVIAIDAARNRVRLKTTCYNQREEVVLTGEALVMPPKAEDAGVR